MRNIKRILKENDLGDMGIGAMIVFIAMVLVAGIAASVLIQTANRLEIQAMKTGQETTEEVATGIGIEDITGQKGSLNIYGTTWATNNSILNMTICVSPRSGSKDIDLSNTIVELSDSTGKYLLTYNNVLALNPAATGVFSTLLVFGGAPFDNGTAKEFSIIVLEDADGSCIQANPVINRGDHVLLTMNTAENFGGLTERTDIWGMVIPESGAPGVFAFRTPASYPETIFDLY
jgi:flagellin FlaB